MVYKTNTRTIELKPDKTFNIKEENSIIQGTYSKSILDTNKFIITFKADNSFLMYFDLDAGILVGNTTDTETLQNFRKQSSQSFFRNIIKKLFSVIKF